MRLETDVLIAGLGPAGGAAALAAAQGGLSVAVVERRQEIGIPVQCAEWIPLQLGPEDFVAIIKQALNHEA